MARGKQWMPATLLFFALGASGAQAEECTAGGGRGDWRYDCAADGSCILRPTRVVLENQHGRAEETAFPLRFVIGPTSGITVAALPDSPADRLEISYGGEILATVPAGASGGFAIGQGKTLVDIGHALEGGKRLLLVFVDTELAVNTAVAALGHDGFDASLAGALAASEAILAAARDEQPCP
jgi:hypothetical protein